MDEEYLLNALSDFRSHFFDNIGGFTEHFKCSFSFAELRLVDDILWPASMSGGHQPDAAYAHVSCAFDNLVGVFYYSATIALLFWSIADFGTEVKVVEGNTQ